MSEAAGRACPLHYRYGADALATAPERRADTLYVVGGLYGNLPALDAVEQMAAGESGEIAVCFNGDFNWFNVDDASFAEINRRVLGSEAILGNVEAEFGAKDESTGCGCAYPASVDDAVVARSNRIHERLKAAALRHEEILAGLSALPMHARYRIGDCRVAVVHGDAESLAGWRFDVDALDAADARAWIDASFDRAQVDVFAGSHTCLPALRLFGEQRQPSRIVINNGAAGMPNFDDTRFGLLMRISLLPSPYPPLYGVRSEACFVDALPIRYDAARWEAMFLANWPPGSDAHRSYFERIARGPSFRIERAFRQAVAISPSGRELISGAWN